MWKRMQVVDFISTYFPPPSHRQSFALDDPLYRCLEQVYCLHPDLPVARRVLLEATQELFVTVLRKQEKRPPAHHPFKARLTPWELFQVSIFGVSERWEKDQESPAPQKTPWYTPTASILLTRFVKLLAFSHDVALR